MVAFNDQPDIMRVAGELAQQIARELRAQRPEIMDLNMMSEVEANVAIANALMIASAVVFDGIYGLPIGDLGLEFNEVVRKAAEKAAHTLVDRTSYKPARKPTNLHRAKPA
jgi:hypothetical protein